GYARTLTTNDRGELLVDVIISADLSGAADLSKQQAGGLVLSGNNSGLSGAWTINSNPGNNQPSLLIGSDTALGTGVVFPVNTVQIAADAGPRTISNRFIPQDLRLSGGNDLTITGPVDLTQGVNLTVFAPVNFTLAGGVGELVPGSGITKVGPGFLNLTGPSLFSGGLTVNAAGGTVLLGGAGTLPNVSSVTVNLGGSFIIDNSASANIDRLRNAAGITLSGGDLEFRGNPTTAVNEIVGTITTSSNFTSIITTVSRG